MPYLARKASTRSGDSGAVPEMSDLRLARSARSTSASRSIRTADGTAGATAGRLRFTAATHASTLNFRSEEHTSELQSLMRISYAVFCLKKKKIKHLQTCRAKEPT